jgi:hypothetical protein
VNFRLFSAIVEKSGWKILKKKFFNFHSSNQLLTMEQKEKDGPGCLSIFGIIVCILISGAVFSPLVPYIGFLAYPLIIGGGILLGKATEPIWYRENKE